MSLEKHQWPSFDAPGDKAAKALLEVDPLLAAYDDALLDALHYGAGFIRVDADGVHHIPYAEAKNNTKCA